MTIEQLEENRQVELAHLNVVRRMRAVLQEDARKANDTGERWAADTIDLDEYMAEVEHSASNKYASTCLVLDNHRARMAGLPESPKP